MSNDVDQQLDRLAPANLLKELDTEDPETPVYMRVYVGCTSCEYGNMGVCCVCVRVRTLPNTLKQNHVTGSRKQESHK